MQVALTLAGAAASGVALWAASPAVGLGWLAWIALVPAGAAAFRGSRWALPLAFGIQLELLLVPALPFGLTEDQWADPVVPVLVGGSPVLFAALVAVPAAVLVLGAARFPLVGTSSLLVAAAAWTALDLLRTKLDPSGLWGALYLTQNDTAGSALAALGGPWLVTFALVAVNLGLAKGVRAGAGALVLVTALAGAAALADPGQAARTTVVAAVQPGYDTAEYDDLPLLRFHRQRRYAESAETLVRDLAPLTRDAARRGAEVIVWPEAAVWVEPQTVRALPRLARETGATIVVPFFLREPAHGGTVAVRPDGTVTRAEPKHRPMWFLGERGGNIEGPPRPLGRLGPMLGVDSQDASVARSLAAAGAALLTSSTHDWQAVAPQHRAFARLASRAVGRPVVRADWRYGSAVYEGGRSVVDAGTVGVRTVVVARVGAPRDTVYVRIGDVVGWAAAIVAVAALVMRLAGIEPATLRSGGARSIP